MNWSLKQATVGDYDYLWQLHQDTMRIYVEETWGWDESVQHKFFRDKFVPEDYQLLLLDDTVVGCLQIRWHIHELHIENIQIEPAHQGNGLGSVIIRSLLERALEKRRDVSLRVLKCNPALRLYQRLQFEPTIETDTHVSLAWKHRKHLSLEHEDGDKT